MVPGRPPTFKGISPRNFNNLFPTTSFFPSRQFSWRTKFSHQHRLIRTPWMVLKIEENQILFGHGFWDKYWSEKVQIKFLEPASQWLVDKLGVLEFEERPFFFIFFSNWERGLPCSRWGLWLLLPLVISKYMWLLYSCTNAEICVCIKTKALYISTTSMHVLGSPPDTILNMTLYCRVLKTVLSSK